MKVGNTVPVVWNPVRDSKRGRSGPGGTDRGVAVSSLWPLVSSRTSTVRRQAIVWERLRQTGKFPLTEWRPNQPDAPGMECAVNIAHTKGATGLRVEVGQRSGNVAFDRSVGMAIIATSPGTTPRLHAGLDRKIIPLSSREAEQARSRHATERGRGCGVQPSALHGNQTTPPSVPHESPALCLYLVRDQECDTRCDPRRLTSRAWAARRNGE